ncbi:MAG TPA: hypothetical protein VG712_06830, partial [Gemmatimonadales bacterium]|nr:hypothetical protein [Gemmatimonadales bacterium]
MFLSRKHLAVALLLASAACADAPTEPGRLYSLPAIEPRLVLPPGTTPASFGLAIDTVGLYIAQVDTTCGECGFDAPGRPLPVHPSAAMLDTVYIDTLVPWPANQESFSFRYEVPPPEPGFAIEVYLYFYGNGQLLFYGGDLVDFRRGAIHLPPIDMYYNGPGYNADDIQMAPGDTAMATGDTLQFVATAYNNGLPLDTVYISWRTSDPSIATIDHLGRLTLRSGALGKSFLVSAAIPNGAITTTRVAVPNPVTTLQKLSGDSQSVGTGRRTPLPLVVRALDAQGKPVAGARIRFFAPVSPSGVSVPDSVVFTDQLGRAATGPVVDSLGGATVRARVTGAAPLQDFTVTGVAGTAAPILFTADSGGSGFQLYRADSTGGNRIVLGYPAAAVPLAGPRWNPARTRVAYTAYNANAGIYQLLLTTAIGDTTAVLVSDSNATGARFSPTGKMIAFICHGMVNGNITGGVCTVNAVDGILGALTGAGDGAGRTDLSGLVPGRPDGPPAFAWRPDASTRIAFVRDTILDSLAGTTASRIYSVNGDGTTLTPLSPRIADLGRGPLRIQGGIDWSPDQSTIVFTASDTTSYEASLYALDVATGAIR